MTSVRNITLEPLLSPHVAIDPAPGGVLSDHLCGLTPTWRRSAPSWLGRRSQRPGSAPRPRSATPRAAVRPSAASEYTWRRPRAWQGGGRGATELDRWNGGAILFRASMTPALFVEFGSKALRWPRRRIIVARVAPWTGGAGTSVHRAGLPSLGQKKRPQRGGTRWDRWGGCCAGRWTLQAQCSDPSTVPVHPALDLLD